MYKVKTGIIPAAGMGLRTGYLSKILPKCLLPIYDRPILQYIIDNMVTSGITDIRIVVNNKRNLIFSYLDDIKIPDNVEITTYNQWNLNGDGNAVTCAMNGINEPFIVVLGDDFSFPNPIVSMLQIYNKHKPLIIEGIVPEKDKDKLRNTCSVEIMDNTIIDIIEKPKFHKNNFRGCGIYLFDPVVFREKVDNDGYLWISDIIKRYTNTRKVYNCLLEVNVNINTPDDLLRASQLFKEKTHK